ncbi:Ger(x)C family spore germination C-terminal domain-containing protein [Paenibacillus mucilaginosus]|uniref:Germination protein, GerC family n=2 Tax=Paenibacillus mucilaginosus TaxID=61624 RepID=H6NCR1_9BACL|nr:Ger(x)C family spore germination C-terminal domain-containing protein [Paenibacillus mucilaginosus]AEI40361.1 germination protein, Ger(x)C family [Paenibacillus mucilaginosus KNP414]AFC28990.1 germination protein, GerC family [Paenibacillus mucilaginosus 3016]MCG7213282.1 spore gernimation protein GerC [Paenibacillus mucilaginosus]WDM29561.1 spore gernimation protein GerC [Paenibacillus mucilaginosus]WFA17738.1 spore gernimation protein GerC [Paenibacillus mucilaginosus]
MKKAAVIFMLLLVCTGCWDQKPLRNLHLVDVACLDLDEKSGEVLLNYIVTVLNKAGQGEGDPKSETTLLKGPSFVEAVGQGDYFDEGPFLGIHNRIYLLSEGFASRDPIGQLAFLLHAPYASINTPVVIFEGSISKLMQRKSFNREDFTETLNHFIMNLESSRIIPNVSMMHFILSKEEPLEDIALPVIKQQSNSELEFSGALLFRQGTKAEEKLSKEQVQILMLLLGENFNKHKVGGRSTSGIGQQLLTGHMNSTEYAFSIKKGVSRITIHPESNGLPKVIVNVKLKINVYKLGQQAVRLKSDYVNQMEKQLNSYLEERAVATIRTMQKANSDVLGIGRKIYSLHPGLWKSLD